MKKIVVVGLGYVGFSAAVFFAQKHKVIGIDTDESKIKKINNKISPIQDKDISSFLETKNLNLKASTPNNKFFNDADYIFIATPTDFDEHLNRFNTSSVDSVIKDIDKTKSKALIIIKSTLPFGYTNKVQAKYKNLDIIFSPEFLREGKSLHDNLYPSRIIFGGHSEKTYHLESDLNDLIQNKTSFLKVTSDEAEAIKLFSNTYLALRVSFFNELDSFAFSKNLSSKNIIDGVCEDPRIGKFYNNPSFGYGGYCLPKDTKQLLNNFEDIPQKLIEASISSNLERKKLIGDHLINSDINNIGIYRLVMKSQSDNFRVSAIIDIVNLLKNSKKKIFIYEPLIDEDEFDGIPVIKNLDKFKELCDLIVANRIDRKIKDSIDKVFTRDIFENN